MHTLDSHSVPAIRRLAPHRHLLLPVVAALLLALLTGCASQNAYRDALLAEQQDDWDQAVLKYLEAVREHPDNLSYRAGLMRAKVQAAQEHVRRGKSFREAGVLERSLVEYRQAVELDPSNQYAGAELRRVAEELQALRNSTSAPRSIAEMKEGARGARAQPPILVPNSDEPIDLVFSKPVDVFDIYRALGKAFGINVLFDPKLKTQKVAIELMDVTAQSGFEIVMRTVSHFYKVLDPHTLIIADDTPQNRRNYEDQVIQTFFLDNAEVKDVMTMVRSLIGAKHVAANEQLNAIVLRDTADTVKVAEQIILTNDKAKAEVVIDVELLEINTSKLQDLGMGLDSNRITSTLDLGSSDAALRLSDIEFLNANNWVLTIPNFFFDFLKSSSDAQVLAQPKIRITEGEKGSLVIGDRVPIPTTTFNTSNTVGGNIVPVTSFQYQEVGTKIEIEPRVHHNEEITLKLKVEVSSIADFVSGSGGQQQPVIGTRTIESSIRLRDGETNFLAGLIRSEELQSWSGIPGVSDLPILGRLFRSQSSDRRRTDIVLTLTPHVIRRASIEESDLMPIWVGTEANISFNPGSPQVESNVSGPFDGDQDARDQIREQLRERLRRLPRGLQDAGGETDEPVQEAEEQAPRGVDLAPTGFRDQEEEN